MKLFIHIALLAMLLQAFAPVVQYFSTTQVSICYVDEIDEDGVEELIKDNLVQPKNHEIPVFYSYTLRKGLALFSFYTLRCCAGHAFMPDLPPEH